MAGQGDLTITGGNSLATAGEAANRAAARHVFDDYRARKSDQTLRRQRADLALFAECLAATGIPVGNDYQLQCDPDAWRGVTWGLVAAFVQWQLAEGYAIRSINVRLSTVKTYTKLAFQAGAIDATEHALIRTVTGYAEREARHVDERRQQTRYHAAGRGKKAEAIRISPEQAQTLRHQHPDTPQGRRDALLMCLLLDHGLRVGEVARLTVENFDLKAGNVVFYRPKVDKVQTHKLSRDTRRALKAWFDNGDAPLAADARILRGSRKNGQLAAPGMSERAITRRVRELGRQIGVEGLSAHDCRHFWASYWAGKVDTFRLQEAGGWNSLAMPRRYVEHARIANEGMEQ